MTLHRLAGALWSHAWVVVALCALAAGAAVLVTPYLPRTFEATGTLLVTRESQSSGVLGGLAAAGLLQQVPGLPSTSATPNRDMLVSVLRSRTMAAAAVDRYRLAERYGKRLRQDALDYHQKLVQVRLSREGVISVRVEDSDPRVAADVANFYLDHLDTLMARFSTTEAGQQRRFYLEQLARARTDLEGAESALRRFQEQNRAMALQEQMRGAVEATAKLKGEIMAAEVQRQVLRGFATESNPEMVALGRRIEEMKRQLAGMQYGDEIPPARAVAGEKQDLYVPFAQVPQVGLELARLTRQVRTQETLVAVLTQQVEQLKIAEDKDLPVVRVLDRAVPAERHSRPRLRDNLVIAGGAGFGLACLIAIGLDRRKTRRSAG